MQLYKGTSQQFVEEATHDQITEKLEEAFTYHFGLRSPEVKPDPGRIPCGVWASC
jgi:hypothetical protein